MGSPSSSIGGSNTGALCAVQALTEDGLVVVFVVDNALKPIAESMGDIA